QDTRAQKQRPDTQKQPDTHKQYETLLFFYNSLGECVRAGLCDFASANAMFGDDVLTFYDNMYPDLMVVCRSGYEADGVFYFISKTKKSAHCERDAQAP